MVLLFLGREFLKELLFPVVFLIFMIPLPLVSISVITFKLKILASQFAVNTLNWLGIHAIREGGVIKTAHSYLVVEDTCSGMRSLIVLIALSIFMAYFSKISKTKKILFSLSTIPIAIVANVIRIAVLALISEIYGIRIATGVIHNIMGIFEFVLAFLWLFLVQKVLEDEK
jgi:exosortase